ncbi:DUF6443 domain-containing protein [Sphingobacterium anhuiense]|uniref:DUF6443 domain-containing protein n=1 Tax=Sphingobacterium anhuiense TaxID=493780 RepID=A0ABW5YV44_9SPHI
MKRHMLLTIAIASFLVSQGQILPKDTILSAYNNQTSIQALNSITLKNGFTIPSGRNVTISIVAFPTLVSQPSAGQNYILKKTFREAGVTLLNLNASRNIGQENQTVQYVDGLGRPLQTVQLMASPTYKDIIQHIEYDGFGRESKKYLPYGENTATNGSYRTNVGTQVLNYYAATATGKGWDSHVKKTPNPYAVTVFENSPLNRVLEQGAPGLAWQPATDRGAVLTTSASGHTVVTDYGTNVASDVRMWTVTAAGTGATSAFYAAGKLYKTVVKDENWILASGKQGTVEEYKDFEDRIVLKRVWETDTKKLETHYVYDDFGDLRYVIPPGYTATTVTDNNADFNELLYAYKYDGRRRLIEKKIPGKGWEYLVYNKNDQLILSQDAVQRGLKKWSYSKYDVFGRIASTGIYTNGTAGQTSRAQVQTLADAVAPQWETRTGTAYSISSFPTTASQLQELTVNYYDDYSFKTATVLAVTNGLDSTSRVKGLLTGTKVSMDDGTLPLLTVNYYDDYGRVIQTAADNHIGGTDYVTNTYSFVGELKTSTRLHKDKAGTQTATVTSNEYDHVGRLLATTHHIGDVSNAVTLTKNEYNEIGQLKKNSVGGDKNGANFHSAIDYAYNERGWTSSASSAQFSYALKYNEPTLGKQYNGNISEQHWAHSSPTLSNIFKYSYDGLNRLKNGTSTGTVMIEDLAYDDMGNITVLKRNVGNTATLTTTSYAYNNANKSNRLLSVTGGVSGTYTYDLNGNAKTDRTGMNFNYNHLNLPDSAWNAGLTVKVGYLYDALGTKLRKYSTQGGNRDYVGGIEYNGNTIELIHTGAGVAYRNSNGTYTYRYNLTDHLGNVRSTVYRNPSNNNAVEVLQKDDYYPFGKQRIVVGGNNKYLYNGKEIQGELGGQYDYGARFYDAEIGRWNVIDPLAESYHSYSPYNYALNDPIGKLDPNGMWVETAGGWSTNDTDDIAAFMQQIQESDKEDPPKKKGNILANGRGSIIRKNGRSQVQKGNGSSDAFLDNGFELGIGFTPIGTFFDFKAAISGEDMSGERLSPFWRWAGLLPLMSEAKKLQKLHHIFNSKNGHALESLVEKFGSQEKAFEAVEAAANKALKEGKLNVFPNGILPSSNSGNIIKVGEMDVRLIGGRVINGNQIEISSFSRKGL